jgi:hypothetical protein
MIAFKLDEVGDWQGWESMFGRFIDPSLDSACGWEVKSTQDSIPLEEVWGGGTLLIPQKDDA